MPEGSNLTYNIGVTMLIMLGLLTAYHIYRGFDNSPRGNNNGAGVGDVVIDPETDLPDVEVPDPVILDPAIPDLDRPLVFPDSMSESMQRETELRINNFIGNLEANPDDFNSWMDLGLLRKLIEDYEGAREAWEYGSIIRSKNTLSFLNLGVLYGYFLKDNARAELNYLKAIENNTADLQLYGQTYEFYRDVLGDNDKARQIIEIGVKNNPDNVDLKNFLEQIS